MIFRERDQVSNKSQSIEGRKINNSIACNVKETRTFNPLVNQILGAQETFETDSFKQILTKRSTKPNNKENISANGHKLKKIKQQTNTRPKKHKQNRIPQPSEPNPIKKKNNKNSTSSLNKLFRIQKSRDQKSRKHRKSYSPERQLKNYRSGPQNKNYISNYGSKNTHEMAYQRSEKALTERIKNHPKSIEISQRDGKPKEPKNVKKQEPQKKVIKKRKNLSKTNLFIKQGHGSSSIGKLENLAKQFDCMVKKQTKKKKKTKKLNKTSRQKKVILSVNQSNNNFERIKKPLPEFSDDSIDCSQNIMKRKYSKSKLEKNNERLSFDPAKRKKKESKKIKTQCLSPMKEDHYKKMKNQAATKIQKTFRGYITRKYLEEFRSVMKSVIDIQRVWRGYQVRKQLRQLKEQESKNSISRKLMIQSPQKLHQLIHSSISKAQTPEIEQLTNLLEQILYEENVDLKIKQRIVTILNKEEKSSARSSIRNHSEAQIESERLFFRDIKEKRNSKASPTLPSKLDKNHLLQSPQIMVDNLLTIQQFQRDKLISNANLQKQSINQLAIKKIFSPRTHEIKTKQIDEKLQCELLKFQNNMDEVLKSCRGQELLDDNKIKPFSAISTPQHQKVMEEPIDGLNSSQRKIQDLSMQLLDYYDDRKLVNKKQEKFDEFDSTYNFMEDYLLNMFEYVRQTREEFKKDFIVMMKRDKNLKVHVILKNLVVVTEDSEEDITFKLPMYKYLENNFDEMITREISESFNDSFQKLQRNQLRDKSNLQDIFLKMIIDCINEAFYCLRPSSYIFTQTALRSQRMKNGLQTLNFQNQEYSEVDSQFSYYFALAMQILYKWANLNCGITLSDEIDPQSLVSLNQKQAKQFLKMEAEEEWIYYDELIEIIVTLSETIFDEVVSEECNLLSH